MRDLLGSPRHSPRALGFAWLATVMTLVSAFACGPPVHDELDLDTIVRRHTEAMGGREKLETIESVWRQRGERVFTLRAKPHFLLVVVLDEQGAVRYAEGFDGAVAWEQSGDGPRTVVEGRPREALWHTTQFPSNLNPLYRIESLGHELELIARDTLDQTIYHRVRLRLSDGFQRDYFINAETYRIERSRDVRRHHAYEEEEQPIEAVWSDFRQVDGFWFPFVELERNFETGERLSGGAPHWTLRVNVDVPNSVFRLDGDIEPLRALIDGPATNAATAAMKTTTERRQRPSGVMPGVAFRGNRCAGSRCSPDTHALASTF